MKNKEVADKPLSQQFDIFSIAFNQRKRINLQKLATFFEERQASLVQRRRIYLLFQDTLIQKIQATRQTIKDFINYFEDVLVWYQIMFKNTKKIDLDKKAKDACEFSLLQTVVSTVQGLHKQQISEIQGLTNWVQKTVLPALNNAFQGFKDNTKILKKEVHVVFNNTDSSRHTETKFYANISDSNDLLQNQIYLIDKIETTNNLTVDWGTKLLENWNKLLKQQMQVRQLLKGHILEYNKRHCKIYHSQQTNKNIQSFWKGLQKQPQIKTIFSSFLQQKQMEFISFGSKKLSFYDKLQEFIQLTNEDKRYGNMLPLIEILQNKSFKSKVQRQKKQWLQIKMYFSLDQHILMFDVEKKKLLSKIRAKGVQAKRVTENMVTLIGKQTGVIFDSTKKQSLHFKTMDQMEQFVYYIENIMAQNNPSQKDDN